MSFSVSTLLPSLLPASIATHSHRGDRQKLENDHKAAESAASNKKLTVSHGCYTAGIIVFIQTRALQEEMTQLLLLQIQLLTGNLGVFHFKN